MNWTELMPFLKKGQTTTTRFIGKSADSDELGATLAALANGEGGQIILGMDLKNFHLYGSDVTEASLRDLVSRHCVPEILFQLDTIDRGGRQLGFIAVKTGDRKPYYYKQKCYRVDDASLELIFEHELTFERPAAPVQPVQQIRLEEEPQEHLESVSVGHDSAPVQTKLAEINIVAEPEVVRNPVVDVPEIPQTRSFNMQGIEIRATSSMHHSDLSDDGDDLPLKKRVDTNGLNRRQKKLLTYLQKRNTIRNKKYRQLYGVSHKTAHLELVDLMEKDIVVQEGAGRSTHYILHEKYQTA